VAGGYLLSRQLGHSRPSGQGEAPALQSGTALPQPRPVAPFSLTDHQGVAFDAGQLVGTAHLLFFGFTHCPDICPTTLALLSQLSRDPALSELQPVFITVDPERDTQEVMKRYVEAFGGHFIGLRPESAAQLDALASSIGAAYSVEPSPDGGSRVDHTATLFFIDGQGRLAAVFTPPFQLRALRDDLALLVAR
jgi:protein SCO1